MYELDRLVMEDDLDSILQFDSYEYKRSGHARVLCHNEECRDWLQAAILSFVIPTDKEGEEKEFRAWTPDESEAPPLTKVIILLDGIRANYSDEELLELIHRKIPTGIIKFKQHEVARVRGLRRVHVWIDEEVGAWLIHHDMVIPMKGRPIAFEMKSADKDTLITRMKNREDMMARIQATKDAIALSAQDTIMREPAFEHQSSPRTPNVDVHFLGPPVPELSPNIATQAGNVETPMDKKGPKDSGTEDSDMAGGAETTLSRPDTA